MALSTAVGSFSSGTGVAGTTIEVNVTGAFQPKAVIFWWNGRSNTVDAVGGSNHRRGAGFATGTTARRVLGGFSLAASANADSQLIIRDDACVATCTQAAAVEGLLDLQSFDADGFTMVVDDQFATDLRVHYLALGGDDLTNATVGTFTERTSAGSQSITGVGFQGDFVMFLPSNSTLGPPDIQDHSIFTIGAATSASQEAVMSAFSLSGQATMDTYRYCKSAECVVSWPTLTSLNRAEFTQFTSDGLDINWVDKDALAKYVFYLVLKGGRYAVGDLLTQTDTTTDIVESSVGVGTPKAVMFVSHCTTQSTADTPQTHDEWSMGAATSTTARASVSVIDEDGTANSEIATGISYDEVYQNLSTADAVEGEMDLKSMDSDGFTCIMDDADPAQAFVWYVAIGDNAAAAATGTGWVSSLGGWW